MMRGFAVWSALLLLWVVCACADDMRTVSKLFHAWSGGKSRLNPSDVLGHMSPDVNATIARLREEVFPVHDKDGDGTWSYNEFLQAWPVSGARDGPLLKQGHLSFGGEGRMWIMWVTDEKLANPFVTWGQTPNLTNRAPGSTHTYNVGLLGWHKHIYQAEMTSLAAGGKYFYAFGHTNATVSSVHSFRMPDTKRARIVFHGDQGTIEPVGNQVAKMIAHDCGSLQCDAVHVLGDLAYAWKSAFPGPEEEWIWDLLSRFF